MNFFIQNNVWMALFYQKQAQDVVKAHGGSAQQVGLQSDTVTVAAGSLVDGVQTGVLQSDTGSQGRIALAAAIPEVVTVGVPVPMVVDSPQT